MPGCVLRLVPRSIVRRRGGDLRGLLCGELALVIHHGGGEVIQAAGCGGPSRARVAAFAGLQRYTTQQGVSFLFLCSWRISPKKADVPAQAPPLSCTLGYKAVHLYSSWNAGPMFPASTVLPAVNLADCSLLVPPRTRVACLPPHNYT